MFRNVIKCTYSGINMTFWIGGPHPHYDVTGGGANDSSELHINLSRNTAEDPEIVDPSTQAQCRPTR